MNTPSFRTSIVLADNRRNDRAFAATLLAMLLAVVMLPFAVPADPSAAAAALAATEQDLPQARVYVLEPVVITGRRARSAEVARGETSSPLPAPQI